MAFNNQKVQIMRILTVQFRWLYNTDTDPENYTVAKRREALSNIGIDVTKIDDSSMQAPCIGMNDTQFVEMSIVGDPEMKIVAVSVVEQPDFPL